MDEIFGRQRFIATFVWERDKGGRGDADISLSHDYILAYAKNRQLWAKTRNLLERTPTQLGRFKNPDGDPRGPWRQGDDGTAKSGTEKQRFKIRLPSGREVTPKIGRYWAFSKETFEIALSEGRVYFGKKGNSLPVIKRYLTEAREGVAPRTWWPAEDAGTHQSAKRDHLGKLLPHLDAFSTPKPEELIHRILQISSNAGDLVVDSFLGSGTTAAVAQKMGRRWVAIEMGEHAVTHCIPRLQEVIKGEPGGISSLVNWGGGGGFRFLKLGEPAFDPNGRINPAVRFVTLAAYVWFLETGIPHSDRVFGGPLLGAIEGTAYFLLYNGILGDRRPDGGNVLTRAVWRHLSALLTANATRCVVYGEACRLGDALLKELNVQFRQIPYDIRMR